MAIEHYAYLYDYQTNGYTGEYIITEDPRVPGRFPIPLHATDIEPPVCSQNEVAVFEDGDWVKKKDYHTTPLWVKSTGQAIILDDLVE